MAKRLKKNVISSAVFKRELALCQRLSRDNDGKCNWGKCEHCGVILLLVKLHQGKLLEDQSDVKKAKEEILK